MPVQKLGPGTHRVSGGRLETNNSSENAQQNNTANLTGSTVVRPQAHRLEIANHSQKWEALVKTLLENVGISALNSFSENAQQNNTANPTGSTVVRPQARRLNIDNHSQKWEALVKTLSENGRR